MHPRFLKLFFAASLIFAFVFSFSPFYSSLVLADPTPQEEKKVLEEELKKLEEEIAQYEADITKTQQEKQTLKNQISVVKKTIDKLNLQIYQSNINIKDIGVQITDTEGSIDKTAGKIDDSKIKLANILQLLYEEDQKSLIEILLAEGKISDFYGNLMALEILDSKSKEILTEIKSLKTNLETQKDLLDAEKSDLEKVVKVKMLQKKESEDVQKKKDSLLKLTEAQYQASLKKKTAAQQKAAEIRARIFEMVGVPKAPTFGEALALAKYAESVTGVSPAFLLAILTQESNVGKNVGQCYLKDATTGSGVIIYSGQQVSKVMKASKDVPLFLDIVKELGRDPFATPVSCPIPSVGGYGGAMGPAQFIPSTWVSYRDRVRAVTGKPADPWNIKDAFLAAAFYVSDYGAGKGDYNSQWKAAMIYFSGTTNKRYRFYGDSVMAITKRYEKDIQDLEVTD